MSSVTVNDLINDNDFIIFDFKHRFSILMFRHVEILVRVSVSTPSFYTRIIVTGNVV